MASQQRGVNYRAHFFNCQLGLVGLQLRILNGVVSLLTTRVENKALAAYVSEQSSASANLQMTMASLEVLACIAFKQPISQAEIDHLFDGDKRGARCETSRSQACRGILRQSFSAIIELWSSARRRTRFGRYVPFEISPNKTRNL